MNILHINSNYLTSKLHENLIDHLEDLEISNDIYMPMKRNMQKEILFESRHSVYNPIAFYDVEKYIFTWKQHKIFKKLINYYRIKNYDVVHAHTLFTDGNIALKLFKKYNLPYVVTIRGGTDLNFFRLRPNLRRKGKSILKHASKIIFISENDKNEMFFTFLEKEKENLRHKVKVMPNGIDPFWFKSEGNPKKMNNTNMLKFLFVGRILKRKNLPSLVNALNAYEQKQNKKIILTIIGKQVDKKVLEEIKEIAKIKLILVEDIEKNKLIHYYRENDIFVMPSHPETFGLVYAEAMSQGLPVIYSNKSGFFNQFEEGLVGFGVSIKNIDDTHSKIDRIISNYENISRNCINQYKVFDWKCISKELKEIYQIALK